MKKIVLLGPPGCGKGTQAKKLQELLKVVHISVGDILREAVANQTPDGQRAAGFMSAGKLVPDEISIALTRERLSRPDCKAGFILDGFPRNLEQALALQLILDDLKYKLDAVIYIAVPLSEIVERLSGRRSCKNCGAVYHIKFQKPKVDMVCDRCQGELVQRKDDVAEVIQTRFGVYEELTRPLIKFYQDQGIIFEIDGSRNVDAIFETIKSSLAIK